VATTSEAPAKIGIRELLEAGLHFGHQTKRWNPKMRRYIFDKRNGIHIIDLAKSLVLLNEALDFLQQTVSQGKAVLFVGTKKQAQQVIRESATRCGQHFVTNRWLGGTLTNSVTIRRSIQRMRELRRLQEDESASIPKKEASRMRRELEKLERNLGGIADMPADNTGALVVIDINREAIAVREAQKRGIPVVAIVDTNCDPDPVDYVIPGNDDAIRAIKLVIDAAANVILAGHATYEKAAAAETRRREEEEARAVKAAARAPAETPPSGADTEAPAGEQPKKEPADPPARDEPKKEPATDTQETTDETPDSTPADSDKDDKEN